jgi:hypothetical protein
MLSGAFGAFWAFGRRLETVEPTGRDAAYHRSRINTLKQCGENDLFSYYKTMIARSLFLYDNYRVLAHAPLIEWTRTP